MTPVEPGATHFVKYEPTTGRIAYTGSVPVSMFALQGDAVIEGEANVLLDYVVGGAVTPRPANPAVLDGMTLRALPSPCVVAVEEVAHGCTDATAELSFSHPGTFTVTVIAFPALDASFQVTQA
jgi:hypothetical protein